MPEPELLGGVRSLREEEVGDMPLGMWAQEGMEVWLEHV